MTDMSGWDGQVQEIVHRALAEDLPWGDVTTETLVPETAVSTGSFVFREPGIVCGLSVAASVFRQINSDILFTSGVADGMQVAAGASVAEVRGSARAILMGERTALNLLQRMSGIATQTAKYVTAIAGTKATIVDTRKTMPGLRLLDKYAVRCGGGSSHRFSLSDGVLVKDNHLEALGPDGGDMGLTLTLRRAREAMPHTLRMEVEVDRLGQIEAVIAGGADTVLLDNMNPDQMREAVAMIAGRAHTEASGGITIETVTEVARTGVELISVGALTHSVRALDIGLDVSLVTSMEVAE